MPTLTVYEKPSCSTCRNLRALLDERGIEYVTVDHHSDGLVEDQLRGILVKLGDGPRALLREREPLVAELGLPGDRTDDELIALMVEHPQLMNRPVVVSPDRAVLARPIEKALELV